MASWRPFHFGFACGVRQAFEGIAMPAARYPGATDFSRDPVLCCPRSAFGSSVNGVEAERNRRDRSFHASRLR